jgi:hypothetical protein
LILCSRCEQIYYETRCNIAHIACQFPSAIQPQMKLKKVSFFALHLNCAIAVEHHRLIIIILTDLSASGAFFHLTPHCRYWRIIFTALTMGIDGN